MLMILLSILSQIRHLICGNNLNWPPNLNLIYEILWTVYPPPRPPFLLGRMLNLGQNFKKEFLGKRGVTFFREVAIFTKQIN